MLKQPVTTSNSGAEKRRKIFKKVVDTNIARCYYVQAVAKNGATPEGDKQPEDGSGVLKLPQKSFEENLKNLLTSRYASDTINKLSPKTTTDNRTLKIKD